MKCMEPQKEQIAPEILQAIIAKAAASGLSVNDYLSRLIELADNHEEEVLLAEPREEPRPNPEILAALQRIAERQSRRPFTKSRDSVTMLREARKGAIWGYEPTE
jgi:hypothetical protein